MPSQYKHTQYGTATLMVFLITGILIAVVALQVIAEGRLLSAVFMLGLYLLGLLMFYALTIEIAEARLKFWFGIGIVRKTIALSEIQSTSEVKNPWYYFWGVKSIPGGWFYAVAPGAAVEIKLKGGGILQLGTNEPKSLIQAIETATQQIRV
ncbi:MAG: hypothetical protein RBT75_21160 [Anaerolineae bacterium]|jgi:hypothetical protein|nr:hypothetical protein [Anaerolineae bacterium]